MTKEQMIPTRAIELAEQEGFPFTERWSNGEPKVLSYWEQFLSKPEWWQALGKALGRWNNEKAAVAHALGFVSVILTNQPTDAFWAELLPHSPHHEE